MAKKKRSLLSELKGVETEPAKTGQKPWIGEFKKNHPDDYVALCELIQDWLSGGTSKALFPSRASLQRYASGKHPQAKCDPPVIPVLSPSTFKSIVDHVEEKGND